MARSGFQVAPNEDFSCRSTYSEDAKTARQNAICQRSRYLWGRLTGGAGGSDESPGPCSAWNLASTTAEPKAMLCTGIAGGHVGAGHQRDRDGGGGAAAVGGAA